MSIDLGPDFRLFCLALRRPQSPDVAAEIRLLAAGVKDWSVIVRGARRHRVEANVLEGLAACGATNIPADAMAKLRRLTVRAARRSLGQVAETSRLARLFAEAGVRVLVLKGAALSAQLYGDPGRRSARDIDLLVDPDQLIHAQAVLVDAGYQQHLDLRSPRRLAAYQRSVKEIEFFHAETGGLVELHYRLADNPDLFTTEFSRLWNDRDKVNLGDRAVATLSRRLLPLYLCIHGGDHAWARLRWLMDFAAALPPPAGTATAIEAADACGLRWPFLHALLLARDWLGAPVEAQLLTPYRDSAQIGRRDWLLARMYAATDWYVLPPAGSWKQTVRHSVWERLYRFSLKSDWHYRFSQIRREWFSAADRDAVRLPERLNWLYPLVRPWGWLIRRLSLSS